MTPLSMHAFLLALVAVSAALPAPGMHDAAMCSPTIPGRNETTEALQISQNRPPIFILGVMKGGTTALWDYLQRHHQIKAAVRKGDEPSYYEKELHYFTTALYAKGIDFCLLPPNTSISPFRRVALPSTTA
jgi:hypothetical protein